MAWNKSRVRTNGSGVWKRCSAGGKGVSGRHSKKGAAIRRESKASNGGWGQHGRPALDCDAKSGMLQRHDAVRTVIAVEPASSVVCLVGGYPLVCGGRHCRNHCRPAPPRFEFLNAPLPTARTAADGRCWPWQCSPARSGPPPQTMLTEELGMPPGGPVGAGPDTPPRQSLKERKVEMHHRNQDSQENLQGGRGAAAAGRAAGVNCGQGGRPACAAHCSYRGQRWGSGSTVPCLPAGLLQHTLCWE